MNRIGILCGLALLMTNALADEQGVEQRLLNLERRVQQLEAAAMAKPAASVAASMPASAPWLGRFNEQDPSAKRWIDFKADGTFILHTRTEPFAGTWEQSGATLRIRSPSGFTEPFQIDNDGLRDSRNVRWDKSRR